MIISKEVLVTINPSNISHYSKFYPQIKNKDNIMVGIEHLMNFSNSSVVVRCDECNIEKEMIWKYYVSYGYSNGNYLCKSCKTKKNNLEKWGVENVFQLESTKSKSRETNLKKRGVEFITQSSEIKQLIKSNNLEKTGFEHHLQKEGAVERIKIKNLERWGVENPSQLEEIKEKKKETSKKNRGYDYIFLDPKFINRNIELNNLKWGTDWYLQSEVGKEKIKETNLEKWGAETPSKNEFIIQKIRKSVLKKLHEKTLKNNPEIRHIDSENRQFKIFCEDCQDLFEIGYFLFYKRRETKTKICTICNKIDKHQSGLEINLQKFIKSVYEGTILNNYRIEGKELDIYLPELKLTFEFNGVYWHSEIFKHKNYHRDKTSICEKNGIQLIHIWEDDWLYKEDIIKSMIVNKIGRNTKKIFARKCQIKEVTDNNLIKEFLTKNHLQGFVGSTVKLGLFHNEILVSLMCFKNQKGKWELTRFCSILNHNIIGASSKLFNYFKNKYSNSDISTFSDKSYSNGKIYELLNFKIESELEPDYKWVVDGLRNHKFNFRNKNTDDIYKIWDCGKLKWIYNKS